MLEGESADVAFFILTYGVEGELFFFFWDGLVFGGY